MRTLVCVFSYNRPELLANCLASLRRFDPAAEIAIFDDDSDDPEIPGVLAQAEREGAQIVRTPAGPRANHGGLYANMNRALDAAAARGFELASFVQDDMQQLWARPDLAAHVDALFAAHPRAALVQVHFVKRLGASRVSTLPRWRAYRVHTLPGDLGVFHVARLRAAGIAFGPDERSWGRRMMAAGLETLATADPVLARVPWPRHARFGRMRGARRGGDGALLNALDARDIAALVRRDPEQRPWGEDWIAPNGWQCWRPFPHDASKLAWAYTIARAAFRQRSLEGLVPRRVGEIGAPAPALEGPREHVAKA